MAQHQRDIIHSLTVSRFVNMNTILLSLITVISVGSTQQQPCNQLKMDELRRQLGVTRSTTMMDVISYFDRGLARNLAENDFFQHSNRSPVSSWPLLNIKCYRNLKRTDLVLSSVYSPSLDVIPMLMNITSVRSLIKIAVVRGDIFKKDADLKLVVRRCDIRGVWAVGGVSIGVKIRKGDNGVMYVSGSFYNPIIQIKPFVESLAGKDVVPLNIESIAFPGSDVNFSLNDARLSGLYTESRGYAITLYGRPSFKGPRDIKILLQRDARSQRTVFALTAGYSSVSLSKLVHQLSGINTSAVPVIGLLTPEHSKVMIATDDVVDVFMPQDDGELAQIFGGRLLKGTSIGTSLSNLSPQNSSEQYVIRLGTHTVTFTTSGVGVPMCDLLKSLQPGFDVSHLSLPHGIPNLLTRPVTTFFYDAEKSAIGANIDLDDLYQRAFNINWVTLNFHKGMVTLVNQQGIDAAHFDLHADIHIGTVGGHEAIGHGTLTISSSPSLHSAHFSAITHTTVQGVVDAFGLKVYLPVSLLEATFPGGLSLVFSVTQETVIHTIAPPGGLKLQGTMNIIGYTLPVSITDINPITGFNIDLVMVPISLDRGLFRFNRAEHEALSGPRFHCNVDQRSDLVQMRMDGHVSLLGRISQPATLHVTTTQYIMHVSTTIFHHRTPLTFYASYGPLPSTTFQVYGKLPTNTISDITTKVVGLITAAAQNATEARAVVQSRAHALSVAQTRFDQLVKRLNLHKKNSLKLKADYSSALAELTDAQRKKEEACSNISDICESSKCLLSCYAYEFSLPLLF